MPMRKIAPNLFVRERDGASYYIVRLNVNGVRIEKSIGSTDKIKVGEAKTEAIRIIYEAQHEKKHAPRGSRHTFASILGPALRDIAKVKQWKNVKSESQWIQSLNDYAVPAMGRLDVSDITVDHVKAALDKIWFTKTETAKKVRGRIEAVLNWAVLNKLREGPNPAVWKGNLEFFFPSVEKIHKNVHFKELTMEQARQAVRYCLEHPSPTNGAILLDLATVVRISEIRFADASEFNKKTKVWTMPIDRRKKAEQFPPRIPLSSLAMKAVKMGRSEGFLFSASGAPLSLDSPRLKLRMILGVDDVTMHGVRTTFRNWAAEHGVDDAVAEKCIAHVWGNKTTQAYYRTDLLEQRREVLERWAEALMSEDD